MADFSPMQQFLMAYGSGLMGTRGAKGFGRAGLMGLEAMDRGTRTSLLEQESKRRESEEKQMAQFRQLQMQQMQAQMAEAQRMRDLKAAWAKRITGASADRQAAAAQAAAPPSFGPVDRDTPEGQMANIFRNANMVNDRAAAAQRASRPMMSYEEALGAQVLGVDPKAVDTWKDQAVGIEMKPGAPYMDPMTGETRFTGDPKEGYTIGPDGSKRPMPGHLDFTSQTAEAQERAKARFSFTEMEWPPGSNSVSRVPSDVASDAFRRPGATAPVPAPVAQPPAPVEPPRAGPPPPASPRPPQPPVQQSRQAVNGAPADPRMSNPGQRYQEAKQHKQWLVDQLNAEQNPARRAELEKELIAQDSILRSLGQQAPQATPVAPQGAPAQPQVQPPQPAQPAAPAGAQGPGALPRSPDQVKRDAERRQAQLGAQNKFSQTYAHFEQVNDLISTKILPRVRGATTGLPGSVTQKVPGTDAKGLQAWLTTLKSRVFRDTLQAMRDLSQTGGAVGQVAVQEMVALQNSMAPLDQEMGSYDVGEAMFEVQRQYQASMERVREAFKQDYGVYPEIPQTSRSGKSAGPPVNFLIDYYLKGANK